MSGQSVEPLGRNGVAVAHKNTTTGEGYRTYEVHQRERVGESTHKIKPIQLISDDYRRDPYPLLNLLRDNYPFYRDWLGNRYWLTPYNDVTSVFTDDANFETRSKLWFYGMEDFGRDFGDTLPVLEVEARVLETQASTIAQQLLQAIADKGEGDLAREFAAPFAMRVLGQMLGLDEAELAEFVPLYWRAQRGVGWRPDLLEDGKVALRELEQFFAPRLAARQTQPTDDVISVIAGLNISPAPSAADLVTTLLERDHETLHGALANLWYLLLTHPEEFAKASSERRLMKIAYLETLRHSTPVLSALRFTRHEVERFGKLLPEGALVVCSAGAANRDPQIFKDPDRFIADRTDICHREPRGQYRADGLASGIAFGLGKPSKHPAVPEDRPQSRYALTRNAIVDASMQVLECLPNIKLTPGSEPGLVSLTVGEMHTCWRLPVTMGA